MFCSNCGVQIDDNSKFCFNCGVKIKNFIDVQATESCIGKEQNCNSQENLTGFPLLGSEVMIKKGLIRYLDLKDKGYKKADEIYAVAKKRYETKVKKIKNVTLDTMSELLNKIGHDACKSMKEFCTVYMDDLKIYDYSISDFFQKVPNHGSCLSYVSSVREDLRRQEQALSEKAADKMVDRRLHKESRGRFVGGGFGVGGAVKGAFQAGILNLITGTAYTLVNAAANTVTLAGTAMKMAKITEDLDPDEFFSCLREDLNNTVDSSLDELKDYLSEDDLCNISEENIKSSDSILENIRDGRIPVNMEKEYIIKGLTLNPLDEGYYIILLLRHQKENVSVMNMIKTLHIHMEDLLSEYLLHYEEIDQSERFDYKVDKKKITVDDAIEYRDKINSNIQKVYNLIDNKLRIKRKDIPEGFVDQFVVDWVVGEPDERLLTIELASFSEDFVVEFGPMSVKADSIDEEIEYLIAREEFEKKINNDATKFLYDISQPELYPFNDDTGYDGYEKYLKDFVEKLENLVTQMDEIDSKHLFAGILIDGLSSLLKESKKKIEQLPAAKLEFEEAKKKREKIYEYRLNTFKKYFNTHEEYGSSYHDVFSRDISEQLKSKLSTKFSFKHSERFLFVYAYEDDLNHGELLTGMVITDQRLFIWGIRGEEIWELEDVKKIDDFVFDTNTINMHVKGFDDEENKEEHKDVLAALNPIKNRDEFLYKLNLYLREINTNCYTKKNDFQNRSEALKWVMDNECASHFRHGVAGHPFVDLKTFNKYEIAKENIYIPLTSKILLLYDTSFWGNWKQGIVFCDDAIYQSVDSKKDKRIEWTTFATGIIRKTKSGAGVYIGDMLILGDSDDCPSMMRLLNGWRDVVLTYYDLFEHNELQIRHESIVSDSMYCVHCGRQIKRTAKFCNYCGNRITTNDK
jgi:hypothetical protein